MTDGADVRLIPAQDELDLDDISKAILIVLKKAHEDELVFGGSAMLVDPTGWTKSTLPEVARRIALALEPRA